MKTTATVALLLLCLAGPASAKCKFDTDDDGLERGKRYTVSAKMTSYVRFEFWRNAGDFYVNAIVGTVLSGIDANVDKSSPLQLHLADGSVVDLVAISESETKRTFFGFGINRKISGGIYRLPEDIARTLTETDVETIVFQYLDDGERSSKSWETRRGDRKNIRKGSACLFEPAA